jgi:hypothetical protein
MCKEVSSHMCGDSGCGKCELSVVICVGFINPIGVVDGVR